MARPKTQPEKQNVLLRVTPEELTALDRYCRNLGVPTATMTRRIFEFGLITYAAEYMNSHEHLLFASPYSGTYLLVRADEPAQAAKLNKLIEMWEQQQ